MNVVSLDHQLGTGHDIHRQTRFQTRNARHEHADLQRLEARWWNTLFAALEDALSLPPGCLRATFLIETLPGAFQMEEILWEIRERAAGLNVGRWDKSGSATYRSYWNGSYLSTRFTGTTVKVKLAEKTVFMAIVDGVPTTYWDAVGTINLTPTPLANGTHSLKIVAKYEKTELPFQGLVLDAGAIFDIIGFGGTAVYGGVTWNVGRLWP